ncbi:MAG TPA: metal ABC transporter ATP-binding protein [Candidatus Thermoplasmatota archaeon]|jgi:zinc transport system ATP-binding protein|nr:metal ABC transporter ATP-binding protein [Candidatus Thermoplasmatota archaeon]
MEPPAVVELRGVSVDYGAERALAGADLMVNRGEFVGIVGPNGGGKTTLLRASLGLVPVREGEVHLFAVEVGRFADWARVGYVPQSAAQVDPQFPATALEVVLLGRVGRRGLFRRFQAADRERARQALREVEGLHLAERRIGTLSGGERQRVFLAKALAGEPELLILDEPTTGVDPKARAEFYQLLDHLNHDHDLTILLVSHDTEAILQSAHRIVAVNRHVVFDGTPQQFRDQEGILGAYAFHVPHTDRPHPAEGRA